MASTLPEDVIFEIVLRVADVKSIGRFKCVSKAWRSHLSTPRFAASHLQIHTHNRSPESIISISDDCSPIVTSFAGAASHRYIVNTSLPFERMYLTRLLGSCNGLVLLSIGMWDLGLLNPITQQFLKIPPLKNPGNKGYGLGYDSSRNDYKVLSIEQDAVHIYSFREKAWRTLPNSSPYHYLNKHDPRIFVNGRIVFWSRPIGYQSGVTYQGPGNRAVLRAFNLGTEEFETLPLPQGPETFSRLGLTAVGGRVALAVYFPFLVSFDVWLMAEYGVQDSWTKFTIHSPGARPHYNLKMDYCFLDEDAIVFEHGQNLDAYSWTRGLHRDSIAVATPTPDCFLHHSISFRGSLLSPHSIC